MRRSLAGTARARPRSTTCSSSGYGPAWGRGAGAREGSRASAWGASARGRAEASGRVLPLRTRLPPCPAARAGLRASCRSPGLVPVSGPVSRRSARHLPVRTRSVPGPYARRGHMSSRPDIDVRPGSGIRSPSRRPLSVPCGGTSARSTGARASGRVAGSGRSAAAGAAGPARGGHHLAGGLAVGTDPGRRRGAGGPYLRDDGRPRPVVADEDGLAWDGSGRTPRPRARAAPGPRRQPDPYSASRR